MVNNCLAKRDTKTCSITYNPSLPGPYYYYWPGNPVIKPFGVAELLIIAACAATLGPRLPARMTDWGTIANRKATISFEMPKANEEKSPVNAAVISAASACR
ncbi:hypothetical protein [Candidatus Spongiihabitans sp.]|uniref:hypothetical protein n=1 Tax=Candidatus Spongiihabitans sp. TaxID=3101308 RepID=UPI003C7BA79A